QRSRGGSKGTRPRNGCDSVRSCAHLQAGSSVSPLGRAGAQHPGSEQGRAQRYHHALRQRLLYYGRELLVVTESPVSNGRDTKRSGLSALWSGLRRGRESQLESANQMALTEIVEKYDVVEVVPRGANHEPYILVAEREPSKQLMAQTGQVNFAELGSSSPSPFTSFAREEY